MQRTKLGSRSAGDLSGGGERVFFDDGQVRVTESLVTIGHPWNKAFAVSEIRSVQCGENEGNKLQKSLLQSLGWLFLGGGALLWAVGLWVGTVFCGITGLSLLLSKPDKDGPYGVTISTGGFWESEYLSSKSLAWCEAVASAVQQAIAYKPEPPSNDGGQFIPAPQSRLRN